MTPVAGELWYTKWSGHLVSGKLLHLKAGGTQWGSGLPTPRSRSKLALTVRFDTIKTLPKNLRTFPFSRATPSWSLQSWTLPSTPSACLLSMPWEKFYDISTLKRKLDWICLPVFLPSFRTVSKVSTQFEEIHMLTNPEPNLMKPGRNVHKELWELYEYIKHTFWEIHFSLIFFFFFLLMVPVSKTPIF